MDILLTFTGFHDPYFKGLVDEEEQPGPIISLLSIRSFDHIVLFDTPSTMSWSRVGRKDRDDIQREFDPACNRHTLRHRFSVP